MSDIQEMQVQVETRGAVPADAMDMAVDKIRSLLQRAPEPVLFARVTLTMAPDPAVERPAIALASVDLNGRLIRAQAAAPTMAEATERMGGRLRIRLERAARNWAAIRGGLPVAEPHEWRHQSQPAVRAPYFPRPADERKVITRASYAPARQTPDDAVTDLELLDYDFHLFSEKGTGQDSVLYRAASGYRLAQARPRPELLGPVSDLVTVSEHPAPKLAEADAIARLEALGQPFLFFVDSGTGRGNVLYHRHDGHYGRITPEGT